MKSVKQSVKVGDILLCVLIFAVSALIFATRFINNDASEVVISYDGKREVYDLFTDRELEISSGGHTLNIVISDGSVRVSDSTCPDKICKASGRISSGGRMIACLPAGVSIKIEGDGDEKIDWVAP